MMRYASFRYITIGFSPTGQASDLFIPHGLKHFKSRITQSLTLAQTITHIASALTDACKFPSFAFGSGFSIHESSSFFICDALSGILVLFLFSFHHESVLPCVLHCATNESYG